MSSETPDEGEPDGLRTNDEAPATEPSDEGPPPLTAAQSARALVVVALSGALFGWGLGWDFGAFGIVIGYRREYAILIASLVLLALSLFRPRTLPLSARRRILLTLPVLAFALTLTLDVADSLAAAIVVVVANLVMLAALPWVLLSIARLLNIEFLRLTRRDQALAAAIIVAVTVLGGVSGHANDRLLTCENFERAGDYVPPGCTE